MTPTFAPGPEPAAFGHHFLLGLRPGADLDEADKRLLERLRPAGVILYRANFDHAAQYPEWHARLVRLLATARECVGREALLVGIDHEGGTVLRPPAPVTPFAFARRWRDRAAAVGRAMGVELASLGINLDFAPVVDVDSNPANPVIGPRAFGATPEEVIAPAAAFIDALQAEGVLACLKHFPGHGDTHTDSHLELPRLELDLEELRARELRPYAELLQRDVRLVMTAHILFPRLDAERPATFSPRVVDELLRGELGYRGAVVTDDIGMRAVSRAFDAPETTLATLRAGCDLIMVCSHWTSTERALDLASHIARAAGAELPLALLERSWERVAALVDGAPQPTPRLLQPETFAALAALAPLRERAVRVGSAGQTVRLQDG